MKIYSIENILIHTAVINVLLSVDSQNNIINTVKLKEKKPTPKLSIFLF